jgi:hypothetical protein
MLRPTNRLAVRASRRVRDDPDGLSRRVRDDPEPGLSNLR